MPKKKEEKKEERKPSVALRLRRHTLEGVMRDFERILKPLEPLKRKKRKKKKRKEEE